MHDSPLLLDIWRRTQRLEDDMRHIRATLEKVLHWARRFLILGSLWTGGAIGNLSNDQLADLTATLIKRLIVD